MYTNKQLAWIGLIGFLTRLVCNISIPTASHVSRTNLDPSKVPDGRDGCVELTDMKNPASGLALWSGHVAWPKTTEKPYKTNRTPTKTRRKRGNPTCHSSLSRKASFTSFSAATKLLFMLVESQGVLGTCYLDTLSKLLYVFDAILKQVLQEGTARSEWSHSARPVRLPCNHPVNIEHRATQLCPVIPLLPATHSHSHSPSEGCLVPPRVLVPVTCFSLRKA